MINKIEITSHFVMRWLERVEGKGAELQKLKSLNPTLSDGALLAKYLKWHGSSLLEFKRDLQQVLPNICRNRNQFRWNGMKHRVVILHNKAVTVTEPKLIKPRALTRKEKRL